MKNVLKIKTGEVAHRIPVGIPIAGYNKDIGTGQIMENWKDLPVKKARGNKNVKKLRAIEGQTRVVPRLSDLPLSKEMDYIGMSKPWRLE